jgi:hypothetical protein
MSFELTILKLAPLRSKPSITLVTPLS